MATQEEFLVLVWEGINRVMQEHWIDNVIPHSEQAPDDLFAEVGLAVKRLLALGATRRELSLLARHAAFDEAFSILYLLSDPGIDDNEVEMLHESFFDADPSGSGGRLGPAPPMQTPRKSKTSLKKGKAPGTSKPKPGKRKLLKWSQDLCFSPDGTLLASVGFGTTLWKCPEIERLAKISSVSNPGGLAFSPDSRLLAVKSTSGRIAVIDALTRSVKVDFRNQADGEGSNVVFAADGEHVVDGSWAGSHVVRTLDGKVTFREDFTGEMVRAVLRHPDGGYWFRHRDPRLIGRTWPFKQGGYEELIIPLEGLYKHAAFSPDGRVLAVSAGHKHRFITLFSFPSMETLHSARFPSLGMGYCHLSFSPCGRILAVVGDVVVILNATTLKVLEEIPIEYGSSVDFSPTAPLMAVGGSAGEVFETTAFLNALGS